LTAVPAPCLQLRTVCCRSVMACILSSLKLSPFHQPKNLYLVRRSMTRGRRKLDRFFSYNPFSLLIHSDTKEKSLFSFAIGVYASFQRQYPPVFQSRFRFIVLELFCRI